MSIKMAPSASKYLLKWEDFQQNIASSFRELRENVDFSDVTLVCEEGQQVEAHRIILTACSPFFSTILKRNNHSHSMIYMRGLKARDMEAMVDFMYHGEANIQQEDIEAFLALGEELKIKGLSKSTDDSLNVSLEETKTNKFEKLKFPRAHSKTFIKDETEEFETPAFIKDELEPVKTPTVEGRIKEMSDTSLESDEDEEDPISPYGEIVTTSKQTIAVDANISTEDLKAKIRSLMEKVKEDDFRFRCAVCGKMTKGSRMNMTHHIETHISGVSYPCGKCGNVSKTNSALKMHGYLKHKEPNSCGTGMQLNK